MLPAYVVVDVEMYGFLLVCRRGTCFCEDILEFFLVNEQKKRQERVPDSLDSMWEAHYYMGTTVVPCLRLPTSKKRTCIRPLLRIQL